ncbi:single-strand binding family protein [Umbribacter vaginalis]|nr:single-strand binding family protein [Coriobacteriales bacterium DNF00809]
MAINSVSLSGNLARDPEIKTSGSTIICSFCIVVDDNVKNRATGEWERVPNFFDVAVFGKYGDAIAGRLHKGARVFVDGKLHYSTWQAQDGTKRSRVSVYADTVETASQPSAQNGAQGTYSTQNAQTYQPSYNAAATPATVSRASVQAQPSVPPMPQTPPATPQVPQAPAVSPQTPPAPTQAPQTPPAPLTPEEVDRRLEMASFDLPF